MLGKPCILSLFPNSLHKFNKTWALKCDILYVHYMITLILPLIILMSWNMSCLLDLLYIIKCLYFQLIMDANYMNPDQTAPKGAVWFGSILFAFVAIKVHKQMRKRMTKLLWIAGKGLMWTSPRLTLPINTGTKGHIKPTTLPTSVISTDNYANS